jgi:hypothetical protein
MFVLKPGIKADQILRWALPERVFFACGACHILAYSFMKRWPDAGYSATWIKPAAGFTGNHIFVSRGNCAFDYHGHSDRSALLSHTWRKARRWWPGWDAELIPLPPEVLVSDVLSKSYPGLWLREPGQFLYDALPRANAFLEGFPSPPPVASECGHAPRPLL